MADKLHLVDCTAQNIPDLSSEIQIGSLACRNRVFLAPMSGVSDAPFRKMAWNLGAGLVFSEMVASEALVSGKADMAIKAQSAGLPIHAVQIAGREAHWMGLAARMAQDNGAHLIDINMGCPSRRVTSGLSGSALMRDLDHALSLIGAVVAAVDVPVSLKMRLGWDDQSINAPQLAARAQEAGVAMISVHGRTRCQFYEGRADWQAIRAVREATNLPLMVNGDIVDGKSAARAMELSGADGVMVGRASYGKPWLAGHIASHQPNNPAMAQISEMVIAHFEDTFRYFNEKMAIRHFRKHLGWYLDGLNETSANKLNPQLRQRLMTSTNRGDIHRMIGEAFATDKDIAAA